MSKKKGTRAERELIHLFWETGLWMPLRIAGSGSTTLPSPDLIVGNNKRYLAIECKSIKKETKYISKEDINQLIEFSKKFGAEPLVGVRFDNSGWFFLDATKLQTDGKHYNISFNIAKKFGLTFDEIASI